MPNMKGGSGYKKKKKGGGDEEAIIIADMADDQMFGRVTKILGNCNLLVYCEDNRERICHIRGKMRSRMFVHTGDIVILSTRDFEKDTSSKIPRGDICHKYDAKHHSALRKKFPDMNPLLFMIVDAHGTKQSNEGDFDIFETPENDEKGDEEKTEDSSDESTNENTVITTRRLKAQDILQDEDINIDDI
jgi:translation initiation factor 1A